jgi:hypothetical protein
MTTVRASPPSCITLSTDSNNIDCVSYRSFASAGMPVAMLNHVPHLRLGRVVILSDGDVVFQPRKVQRSGLCEAVAGHVLIYIHKEELLDAVARRYPASRTVGNRR